MKKTLLLLLMTSPLLAAPKSISPGVAVDSDTLVSTQLQVRQIIDTCHQMEQYIGHTSDIIQKNFVYTVPGSSIKIPIDTATKAAIQDGQRYLDLKNQLIQEVNQLP
jgi:hypothetical protein